MITRRRFLATSGTALALPALAHAKTTEPFRLGALVPLTGAGSAYGPGIARTMAAAVEAINERGGAGGRRIEFFTEDDQTQPQAGVLAAKKLIEINRVRAILGGWNSTVCMAVMPLTNEANIVLGYTTTAPDFSRPEINKKWLGFRFQGTGAGYGHAYAEICARQGYKRVAILAFNNASALGVVDGFQAAWAARGNSPVARVIYEPAQPSYRAELQRVLASRPDCIVTGSYVADTTILLKEWFQTGATNKWITPSWALTSDVVRALGNEASEGLMSVTAVPNSDSNAYRLFDEAYRRTMSQPGETNMDAAMNWDAVNVLALALEANPDADGEELARQIKSVSGPSGAIVTSFAEGQERLRRGETINYEGAVSSIDFDATNSVSTGHALQVVEGGSISRKFIIPPKVG
jgi:branched-chain amino acid transport system substrate-binding protein